ncbi:phospholipid-binding lipoprotein MlaA [Desulfobaculum xiamenense]|uniref:Phospholipid-binding lipoprotein MlaA n=1 Tax=Desulfobaculum xiamenense TaxID=995050 RepID=A0A846QLV6_9BACT|nr:VacJ family lipoprotein [Desulfobaculum xiamenense]NJB67193.1 phospholipid-binding lipoprotein MlaA [Desulfobaculum xiamenense]
MRMRAAILLAAFVLMLSGCAAKAPTPVTDFRAPVQHAPEKVDISPDSPFYVYDPWERMNRRIYDFNARLDHYVLMPVVETYERIVPHPVRRGVSNFFSNLGELPTFLNCLLQLDGAGAANTFGRFATNTVLGVGGLFDVADAGGLYHQHEDFGQTLAVWGVPRGPYLVLPVLGPSNVRDAAGLAVDGTVVWIEEDAVMDMLDPEYTWGFRMSYTSLKCITLREQVLFRYYEDGSLFEYDLVRFLYSKKREWDVSK